VWWMDTNISDNTAASNFSPEMLVSNHHTKWHNKQENHIFHPYYVIFNNDIFNIILTF
jgi:hypothetical protein